MRAADGIEKITRKGQTFLYSHKRSVVELLNTAENKELKWHLALITPRLQLTETESDEVWMILKRWASDTSESRIVRVNSIQSLFNLSEHSPARKDDLDRMMAQLEKEDVPSIKARIRKLAMMKGNVKTTTSKKYLSDLSSDRANVKYPAAKKLIAIAEKNPRRLYPYLNQLVQLLKSENNILRWMAIDIVGYVSCLDKERRADESVRSLIDFLQAGKLIAANHAIDALSHIALTKPEWRERITNELLKCETFKFETDECHNVVMGKVVQALGVYLKPPDFDARILKFLRRQTRNTRSATRKKAEKMLRSLGQETRTHTPRING
jgi:HEAT repeat protein